MYKFTRIIDVKYTVYHKTDELFDKFDLSFKPETSVKSGIGYNFSIGEADPDLDKKYIYTCEIELDNPLSTTSSTISLEKWQKLQEKLGIAQGISIADPSSTDYGNYKFFSDLYFGNGYKDFEYFLKCVRDCLGVDGLIDKSQNLLVSFDSNKIKIKEKKNA